MHCGEHDPPPEIAGRWKMKQFNGDELSGMLIMEQSGPRLEGRLEWQDHADGKVIGTVIQRTVAITVYYPNGSVAQYAGELSRDGKCLIHGLVTSSTRGYASWSADLL